MAKTAPLLTLLTLAAVLSGCSHADYTTPERYQKGLVLCLSGAGGIDLSVERIQEGLDKGQVGYALEPFRWSRLNMLADQVDIEGNKLRARQLARRIEMYHWEYPDQPIWIVGFSAGTGIIVWAVEDLKQDCRLQGLVLIASSLNSTYDLTAAFEKLDDKIYNFYSPVDPMLGLGVPVAGSVDRQRTSTGGQLSFTPPKNADQYTRDLYDHKLVQRSWKLEDIFKGHAGGHIGATTAAFVREHIAPIIRR